MKVVVFQWPCGTLSTSRFPCGALLRMTAHLRRCHEHRGRRPKAAKEGKRGEWGTRLSGRYGGFGWGRRCGGRPLGPRGLRRRAPNGQMMAAMSLMGWDSRTNEWSLRAVDAYSGQA